MPPVLKFVIHGNRTWIDRVIVQIVKTGLQLCKCPGFYAEKGFEWVCLWLSNRLNSK